MKTINLLIILLLTAVIAYPQHRLMQVHSEGEVAYEINTAQVDSVVFRASLANTKWKLAGVMDVNTGVLKELEPKDCVHCYTLTFDTDSIANGVSTSNKLQAVLYSSDNKKPVLGTSTFMGETGDGYLFLDAARFVTSYYATSNELKFINDIENYYLLFKRIEK